MTQEMLHNGAGPAATTQGLRVSVVDDSPLMLEGIRQAIDAAPDMQVVHVRTSPDGLAHDVAEDLVDMLVIDPWGRGGHGLDAIGLVSALPERITIVALSLTVQPDHVQSALDRGADAFIAKDVPAEDLPALLRQAHAGVRIQPHGARRGTDELSARELEVLALVAAGWTNAQAAAHLFVTEQTIKFHLRNVNRKLGAGNRTQAAYIARCAGLIA